MPASSLVGRLEQIVGASRLRVGALERALFAKDAGMFRGRPPDAVVFPENLAEVVSIVAPFREAGTTLVPGARGPAWSEVPCPTAV